MKSEEYKLTDEDIRVLNTDYPDRPIKKEHIEFYLKYQIRSGDSRLNRGLIRTEEERKEFIRKGLELRLPGM